MLIFLIAIWSLLALLFGTAAMAARMASRTRLTTLLKGNHHEEKLNRFFGAQQEYTRTAMAYHQLCMILFVVTVFVGLRATETWYTQSLYTVGFSLPWMLLFGVGIPAAWARYSGDAFLAQALPALEVLRRISKPLLAFVSAVDEIVRRLAGAPDEQQDRSEQIELEIMDAVSHGEKSGAVDPTERAMIKSVMVLDETSVGEIMTPRTDMVGIDANAGLEQVRSLMASDGHSRFPVFEESMDDILGVLYAKDLLRVTNAEAFSLRDTMRKATFVPETKDLASLLREFQCNRVHIAIVLDEYGGTAGLVTIEDILEELVGEITDEHEQPPPPSIRRLDAQTADIDARLRIEEINEALELELPEDEAYDTVGGFVFSRLGRIPSIGEQVVEGNVRIEILEAHERTVSRLRVRLIDTNGSG